MPAGLLPCGERFSGTVRRREPQRQTNTAPHRSSSSRPSALAALVASSDAAVSTSAEATRRRGHVSAAYRLHADHRACI